MRGQRRKKEKGDNHELSCMGRREGGQRGAKASQRTCLRVWRVDPVESESRVMTRLNKHGCLGNMCWWKYRGSEDAMIKSLADQIKVNRPSLV